MNINANPHTTGGTEKIVFAVKSVRLKTLTEIGSTFNLGQLEYLVKGFIDQTFTEIMHYHDYRLCLLQQNLIIPIILSSEF